MWDLIVSVPDHCLSFYFSVLEKMHVYAVTLRPKPPSPQGLNSYTCKLPIMILYPK